VQLAKVPPAGVSTNKPGRYAAVEAPRLENAKLETRQPAQASMRPCARSQQRQKKQSGSATTSIKPQANVESAVTQLE